VKIPLGPFNRTIVELKLVARVSLSEYDKAFNRTIVELKFGVKNWRTYIKASFNRTIVELKLFICLFISTVLLLLTEP